MIINNITSSLKVNRHLAQRALGRPPLNPVLNAFLMINVRGMALELYNRIVLVEGVETNHAIGALSED
jgi:hypothetical protein